MGGEVERHQPPGEAVVEVVDQAGLGAGPQRGLAVGAPGERLAQRGWCGVGPGVVAGLLERRQTRDFTFVADVVRATRAAAEATHASGRVYNIGGGAQVSLARALELIEGYAGRPLAIEHLAGERGDVRDTGADTSRAHAELGFDPTVPLEDGLREEYEWALGATPARELARA